MFSQYDKGYSEGFVDGCNSARFWRASWRLIFFVAGVTLGMFVTGDLP